MITIYYSNSSNTLSRDYLIKICEPGMKYLDELLPIVPLILLGKMNIKSEYPNKSLRSANGTNFTKFNFFVRNAESIADLQSSLKINLLGEPTLSR